MIFKGGGGEKFLSFSEKKNFDTHLISVTHDDDDGMMMTARDSIHSDLLKFDQFEI